MKKMIIYMIYKDIRKQIKIIKIQYIGPKLIKNKYQQNILKRNSDYNLVKILKIKMI